MFAKIIFRPPMVKMVFENPTKILRSS